MPDYGSVWVPAVSVDWVPYRDGRWVWEPYYGWTWVSNEPWGWAPYHYGRWFYSGASWVWWPGPVGGYGRGYGYGGGYYRPIWAPAYVSFFGFGGGLGVGVGFGSFGWLPIGPCDSFRPWYGGRYGGRFNQVNVTNIYNFNGREGGFRGERPLYEGRGRQYSNLRMVGTDPHVRGAVSAVPAEHFGSGRVAARGIDPGSFREAKLMTGNLPVVPTRESLNASNRAASPGAFRGAQPQHFFGTNRAGSSPQSFDRQAAQVQQSIQRDGHFTPIRSGESAGGRNPASTFGGVNTMNREVGNRETGSREAGGSAPRNSISERGSFPSRETPANQPGRSSDVRPGASEQQGWHRFSGPGGNSPADRGASDTRSDTRNVPMNRGTVSQPESRGESRGTSNGGGWEHFPSSNNRGSEPGNRGNTGASEPARGGSGGWDRGPRPDSTRETGPSNRGSAPLGGYERSRPTLDMRQPVVTPRSSGPSYEPRGGGRVEAPRPSGGGGRTEAPRPSGGGGHESRPSGGGGGGHGGGGRPSTGGHRG
jgi:hypothetical protein